MAFGGHHDHAGLAALQLEIGLDAILPAAPVDDDVDDVVKIDAARGPPATTKPVGGNFDAAPPSPQRSGAHRIRRRWPTRKRRLGR